MISCEIYFFFWLCVVLKYLTYLISSEPISVGYERTNYSTTEMEDELELLLSSCNQKREMQQESSHWL